MELKLYKKPKKVTIIEGFPGFGLVGTIATEFLINHLKTEMIGRVKSDELPALASIHGNKVVQPLGVFYNKQYNLIILHAITSPTGLEWKIADVLEKLAIELDAKEIISIEGVGSTDMGKARTFFYTNDENRRKKLKKSGLEPLGEGIIIGVTGALLIKRIKTPFSCILAETHTSLPDSKAAAEIIKALDVYLGLKIDYKPLIKMAGVFEEKIKDLIEKTKAVSTEQKKKKLSYLG